MKKELCSLEIGYLVKEFQCLLDAKVDSIFHPEKNELYIQFFVSGKGKMLLRILPNFIYITDEKKVAEQPSGFCMLLRKYLSNSRVREIIQIGSERIIKIKLETKKQAFFIFIEMFGNGNVIFCDESYKILGLLEQHTWKDRTLKNGIKYSEPPRKANFYEISEQELTKLFDNDKILVKKLAIDLGLSGVYAEEICNILSIDKNLIVLNNEQIKKIIARLNSLFNKKDCPFIIYENGNFLDVVPFSLSIYDKNEKKCFDSYSKAIEFVFQNNFIKSEQDTATKAYDKKKVQLENMLAKQREMINEIEQRISENEQKAELIYKNYKLIDEIIGEIKKASSKYSWIEIRDKLKNHGVVKEVNTKDKIITLELN
jgi:predicted ribosome quality control (RQC) complex YloA/Tae2 family protein